MISLNYVNIFANTKIYALSFSRIEMLGRFKKKVLEYIFINQQLVQRKGHLIIKRLYDTQLYSNATSVLFFALLNLFARAAPSVSTNVCCLILNTATFIFSLVQVITAFSSLTLNRRYVLV